MTGTLFGSSRHYSRFILAASVTVLSCFPTSNLFAAGPTESIIYSFTGSVDGGRPNGNVVFDSSGAMYGTTLWGGQFQHGAIFKLTPVSGSYVQSVIYSFTGGDDGATPASGLVMDATGALYGTAQMTNSNLAGVVFKLSPPSGSTTNWSYESIFNFSGGQNGGFPNCSLVFDTDGNLLGTTTKGGTSGLGTVFKLVKPVAAGSSWTEDVLYSFTGATDGALPFSSVLVDASGNLFGSTVNGGSFGKGTIWELSPVSGSSAYTFSLVLTFNGGPGGGHPYAPVISPRAGTLYGTTFGGGTGYGVAFKLTAPTVAGNPWKEQVIHTFSGSDGANLASGLVFLPASNSFYGTTFSVSSNGVVFSLTPPAAAGGTWTYAILHAFTGMPDGSNPLASVTFDSVGNLFSTTYLGGAFNAGSVFELGTAVPTVN